MVLIDGTVIRFLLTTGERGDIPEDPTTPIPDVQDPNIPIPYPGGEFTIDEWGNCVYSMSVSGITDVDGNWLKLFGTGLNEQNVWVDVDGQNKGIIVINLEDNTMTSSSRWIIREVCTKRRTLLPATFLTGQMSSTRPVST